MLYVAQSKHLPKIDRISILAATIMLVFILARFANFPTREIALQLPGAYLTFTISTTTVAAIFVIGLTSSGVDWLIREHPALEGRGTYQHWLLPTLTAWAIGATLLQQPFDIVWWVGFTIGSGILILQVIAEYITVDPNDIRRVPAAVALVAVAYALFLILAIMMRARGTRLFIIVPTLTLASGLVSLRVLFLQLQDRWAFTQAAIIMIITGQIVAAFHYLPLSPAAFAVALVGLVYALVNVANDIITEKSLRRVIFEPIITIVLTWIVAPLFL